MYILFSDSRRTPWNLTGRVLTEIEVFDCNARVSHFLYYFWKNRSSRRLLSVLLISQVWQIRYL